MARQLHVVILLSLLQSVAACSDTDPQPSPDASSAGGEGGTGDTGTAGASGAAGALGVQEGECSFDPEQEAPDFAQSITCKADFDALASAPLDASLPGATSAKVVLDQYDDNALYFQNSTRFPIHYEFVSEHLSGGELPIVQAAVEKQDLVLGDLRGVGEDLQPHVAKAVGDV